MDKGGYECYCSEFSKIASRFCAIVSMSPYMLKKMLPAFYKTLKLDSLVPFSLPCPPLKSRVSVYSLVRGSGFTSSPLSFKNMN